MSGLMTRGVVFVHSAPRALCRHVEWAAEQVLDAPLRPTWVDQPAARGTVRTEVGWHGVPGQGAELASALRRLGPVRFEVTEQASPGVDGGRWIHTPSLGIFHAPTDAHGNLLIPEDRVRAAIGASGRDTALLHSELALALGGPWDEELEPFRYAAETGTVRWLHQVG